MINSTNQKGVGLIEVLVALFILALGVLGFSALQLRAIDAAQEATEHTVAMNNARDLAERMRVNRTALSDYKNAINNAVSVNACIGVNKVTTPKNIEIPKCDSTMMAQHDATEILAKASDNGQTVIIEDCVKSTLNCIYVAWEKTNITASDLSNCVDITTGAYVVGSKCLVMEAF
ncbi:MULTISPECIES: type IV pilus modification protein PilV [Acinetobacter]|uniref:type IV pilus modification protein PilV n=1 Tax=Acinetobacter TaxID=469 RepID=UPI0035E3C2E0